MRPMFDAPVDAWYAWLGLSVVSLAVFGVVTALPATPPPDAAGVATTVDRVAVADYDTRATVALDADAVTLSPHRLGLRNDAGTVHATFAYPVVPVRQATPLTRVLRHGSPTAVFESKAAFEDAVSRAVSRDDGWRPVDDVLVVRQVVWGDSTTTLVGMGSSTVVRAEASGQSPPPDLAAAPNTPSPARASPIHGGVQ